MEQHFFYDLCYDIRLNVQLFHTSFVHLTDSQLEATIQSEGPRPVARESRSHSRNETADPRSQTETGVYSEEVSSALSEHPLLEL